MNNVVLAFDFGTKNIGVAIGQYITNTASPLDNIKIQNNISLLLSIKNLLDQWQSKEVVVGLPLNMDGTEQFITVYARKFANRIRNYFGIKVILHDERLSTVEAKSWLFNNGGFRALSKRNINSISAAIILESYFQQKSDI